MDPFSNVYPTLFGCFGIILIGYLFGRLNLVTQNQGKGLGSYIARVALPALLFKSLVALDFTKVDWDFWFGILLSKAVMFFIVALLTLVTTHNDLGRAGLFGIFVTQSNDLALGLPLFDAIYKEVHPEYCQYLYLLVPVSVALINPIGFVMLEFQKNASKKDNAESKLKILLKAVKSVIANPLVFMVMLGLLFNLIFHYTGVNSDHWFLSPLLTVIGNSFGSTALFFLGLSLVGCTTNIGGFTILVPFLLVFCKSLIFPVVARQAVCWLCTNASAAANETSLSSFAFLYGTLPTAPPVAVYAAMYNSNVDTIGTSMVLGTFLSAPIMFVSSKMILVMNSSGADLDYTFFKAFFDTGILSTVCCVWVAAVMFTTKYYRKVLHQCTLALVTCQFLLGLATSLGNGNYGNVASKAISAIFFIGLFGSTIWTVLVSIALTMVRCKGETFVSKKRWIFFLVGICFPLVAGFPLALLSKTNSEKSHWLLKYIEISKPFNYCFGIAQALALTVCIASLITLQRCDKFCRCRVKNNQSEKDLLLATNDSKRIDIDSCCKRCKTLCEKQRDIEDLSNDDSNKSSASKSIRADYGIRQLRKGLQERPVHGSISSNDSLVISPVEAMHESQLFDLKSIEDLSLEEYLQGDSHQLTRHVILILCLCLFSILSIFLCFERINNDMDSHGSGVYIEMEFLSLICTVGQGFVSFAVFGFNRIFFNFISFERFGCLQPWCFARKIKTVPSTQLDEKVTIMCQRFRAHHLASCKADLECDLRFYFKTYKNVFRGNQLVDWIVDFGLANTRMDAVYYGNCLLQGQIIKHCMNEHYFYDLPYFYRFCSEDPSSSQSTLPELE